MARTDQLDKAKRCNDAGKVETSQTNRFFSPLATLEMLLQESGNREQKPTGTTGISVKIRYKTNVCALCVSLLTVTLFVCS